MKSLSAILKHSRFLKQFDYTDHFETLMGDRRLVFRNGEISDTERANLTLFEEMDAKLGNVQNALRNGERIESAG